MSNTSIKALERRIAKIEQQKGGTKLEVFKTILDGTDAEKSAQKAAFLESLPPERPGYKQLVVFREIVSPPKRDDELSEYGEANLQ